MLLHATSSAPMVWSQASTAVKDEMKADSPHRTGALLAGGGMLLISLDSLGLRLSEASAWDNAFWLGAFTFATMAAIIRIRTGRSIFSVAADHGGPTMLSTMLQAGSITFFIVAVATTAVANVVVIVAAAPVVAAVVSRLVLGERTAARTWLAIAAAMGGILLVVSGSLGKGRIEGDLMAVLAILAFTGNLTVWRRHPDLDLRAVVGLSGLAIVLIAMVPADPASVSLRAAVVLAILGSISGPAGRLAVATATRYLPAAQVSLFAPVETIAATAWAWLFLSETPPVPTVVGGIIVIVAVVIGSTSPAPPPAAIQP
jgi:drug/metabolite transporter (DMT)-like permease